MRAYVAILICGMLWGGAAVAADSPAGASAPQHLTLAEAQAIALEHYPEMKAAALAAHAAGQQVGIARSYYLPQMTGDAVRAFAGRDTRLVAEPNDLNNPSVINRGSAGVGVSQLIYDFGHTGDLIASSKFELQAEKDRANLTRNDVLFGATRAYFNLLRAQSVLKVAQATLNARQTLHEQISALQSSHMKSDLDLSIANQVVGEANLLLLQAKNGVDDAEATLSEALGYSMPQHFLLADDTEVVPPPASVDALFQQAAAMNPELASLKAEEDAARKKADAEGEAQLPTISALGYAGATPIREDSQSVSSHSLAAGINISIPFYTGGRLTAEEHEAADRADIAGQRVVAFRNKLLRDVRIAFSNAQTAWQNIAVTRELMKNSDESFELTQERYNIGKNSIVDLNEAQLAKTQAEIANANATYNYLIARAWLNYKIGSSLPPASIAPVAENN